jgi:hypothetical protein
MCLRGRWRGIQPILSCPFESYALQWQQDGELQPPVPGWEAPFTSQGQGEESCPKFDLTLTTGMKT